MLHLSKGQLTQKINIGEWMVYEALEAPFEQILKNAGIENTNKYKELFRTLPYGIGYDVKKMEQANMFESGIIDPTKAMRVALENAASVACLFLTTECVSYETEVTNVN